MGAFNVSCGGGGCRCNKIEGVWAKGAYPFPHVDTYHPGNASTSAFTKFYLVKSEGRCVINVTQVREPSRRAELTSRVRIDMLGLQLASCAMHCELTTRPASKAWGTKVRNRCWSGRATPGFLIPACFEKGPTCQVARASPTFED